MNYSHTKPVGFTLAELLIALVILGVIATFTIPKVLSSQQSSQFNSQTKEAMAMVSGAWQVYQSNNSSSGSTKASDLTPYFNYIRKDVTTTIDDAPGGSSMTCEAANIPCLALPQGGLLMYPNSPGWGGTFNNTAATNAIWFIYDPDGVQKNFTVADGPGKAIQFWLFYNGGLRANDKVIACNSNGCESAKTNPSWFSW